MIERIRNKLFPKKEIQEQRMKEIYQNPREIEGLRKIIPTQGHLNWEINVGMTYRNGKFFDQGKPHDPIQDVMFTVRLAAGNPAYTSLWEKNKELSPPDLIYGVHTYNHVRKEREEELMRRALEHNIFIVTNYMQEGGNLSSLSGSIPEIPEALRPDLEQMLPLS